jgi:hypothetical protein
LYLVLPSMVYDDLPGLCPPRQWCRIHLWCKSTHMSDSLTLNDRVIMRMMVSTGPSVWCGLQNMKEALYSSHSQRFDLWQRWKLHSVSREILTHKSDWGVTSELSQSEANSLTTRTPYRDYLPIQITNNQKVCMGSIQ